MTRAERQANPRKSGRTSSIDPTGWVTRRREAEQLEKPANSEVELRPIVATLGRLLGVSGVAVTGPGTPICALARWGMQPRSWSDAPTDRWQRRSLDSRGRNVGALWIRRGDWETDARQLQFVDATAELIAVTLHSRAALLRERDLRVLAETLQHLSETLASTLELEDVLAQILDELARLVPYDSATVMLMEDDVLRLHAQRGFDAVAGDGVLNTVAFVPGQTPGTLEVISGDQPVIFGDVTKVDGWIWLPGSSHIRSWMGVPLRVQGRVIGMFSIDKAEANFFKSRHVALAAALAPQAAIATDRARLIHDLRTAEAQLRGLSARVIEAQEAERKRIGQELHDHSGQALLALRAELQILDRQIPEEYDGAHTQIARIDEVLRSTARELRLLSHELHLHLLDEFGLGPALEQQVRDYSARFHINTDFAIQGERSLRRQPRVVELAALRIAQEALNNVAQHAEASTVWVRLNVTSDRLQLVIQDDGCGFDFDSKLHQGCFGLVGMRERATAANGALQIKSRPGEGTQIVAEFPQQAPD